MVKYCFICKWRSNKEPRRSFHRFPVQESEKRKWLDVIGKSDAIINKWAGICSIHFEKYCFQDGFSDNRLVLKPQSIPTLHLVKSIVSDYSPDDTVHESSLEDNKQDFKTKIDQTLHLGRSLDYSDNTVPATSLEYLEDNKQNLQSKNDQTLLVSRSIDYSHNNTVPETALEDLEDNKQNLKSKIDQTLLLSRSIDYSPNKSVHDTFLEDLEDYKQVLKSEGDPTLYLEVSIEECIDAEDKNIPTISDSQCDSSLSYEIDSNNDTAYEKMKQKLMEKNIIIANLRRKMKRREARIMMLRKEIISLRKELANGHIKIVNWDCEAVYSK